MPNNDRTPERSLCGLIAERSARRHNGGRIRSGGGGPAPGGIAVAIRRSCLERRLNGTRGRPLLSGNKVPQSIRRCASYPSLQGSISGTALYRQRPLRTPPEGPPRLAGGAMPVVL